MSLQWLAAESPALVALLVVAALSLALSLSSHVVCHCVLARAERPRPGPLPGISVLKPLRGADAALLDNLRAFARLDYPEFELVFGVEDPLDPAIPLVRKLADEFPHVPMRLCVGGKQAGLNPKVNNLSNLSRLARYDHYLVSDADVRPRPGYLRALAAELRDARVGLVHSVFLAAPAGRLGAVLEAYQASSFVAPAVCLASLVGHPCVVGKSMFFRAKDIEALGGFPAFENVLAEDYLIGRRFTEAGKRVVLSPHLLVTVSPERSVGSFFNRHLRWSQMRRRLRLSAFVAEVFANPTPWLLSALLAAVLTLPWGTSTGLLLAALLGGLLARCASDALVLARAAGIGVALSCAPLVLAKDMMILAAWALGLVSQHVHWKGHDMVIGEGTRLFPKKRRARLLEPAAVRNP